MKKMITLLAVLGVSAGIALSAQPRKGAPSENGSAERVRPSREQIVDAQCARLVEELALDDATAAKFSPVFKDYKNDLFAVKKKYQPVKQSVEPGAAPERKTDAEIEKMILDKFAEGRELIDVRESYYSKFKAFLNPRQIQKIYEQEKKAGAGMKHEQMARKGGAPGGMHGPGNGGRGPASGRK